MFYDFYQISLRDKFTKKLSVVMCKLWTYEQKNVYTLFLKYVRPSLIIYKRRGIRVKLMVVRLSILDAIIWYKHWTVVLLSPDCIMWVIDWLIQFSHMGGSCVYYTIYYIIYGSSLYSLCLISVNHKTFIKKF